jgi:hypothetical protein
MVSWLILKSFLLEGMLTVVVAIAAFWLVWDDPKSATFLTEREKDILLTSLSYTAAGRTTDTQTSNELSSHWNQVKAAIFDWQVRSAHLPDQL